MQIDIFLDGLQNLAYLHDVQNVTSTKNVKKGVCRSEKLLIFPKAQANTLLLFCFPSHGAGINFALTCLIDHVLLQVMKQKQDLYQVLWFAYSFSQLWLTFTAI